MASATVAMATPPLLLLLLASLVSASPQDCGLRSDRGTCSAFEVRWYYDGEYGGCLRFWYGGCEGNGNRFRSEAECTAQCVSPPGDQLCHLPAVRGACKRSKPRWFSDPASGGCRRFTYSGCLGNDNRFQSEEECRDRCRSALGRQPAPEPEPQPEPQPGGATAADCALPAREAGSCAQWEIRYSWLPARQQCAPFYYGGCDGNANNFQSREQCESVCKAAPTPAPERPRQPQPDYRDSARYRPEPQPRALEPSTEPPTYYRPPSTERSYYRSPSTESPYYRPPSTEPPYYRPPSTESPYYERQTESPYYDPQTESPYYDPQTARPYYDPETARPYYDSETARPYYDPQTARPYYDPQTEPPYYEPPARDPYYEPSVESRFYEPSESPHGEEPTESPYYEQPTEYPVQPEPLEAMKEDEREEAVDVCVLPPDQGECRDNEPRFYYNAALQSCYTFYYGGCGGNGNRFSSAEECARHCQPAAVAAGPPQQPATTEPPPVVTDARERHGYDHGDHGYQPTPTAPYYSAETTESDHGGAPGEAAFYPTQPPPVEGANKYDPAESTTEDYSYDDGAYDLDVKFNNVFSGPQLVAGLTTPSYDDYYYDSYYADDEGGNDFRKKRK